MGKIPFGVDVEMKARTSIANRLLSAVAGSADGVLSKRLHGVAADMQRREGYTLMSRNS